MNTKKCTCGARMIKVNGNQRPTEWLCPDCGATTTSRPHNRRPANTSLKMPSELKAWLIGQFGGIQAGIVQVVTEAREKEDK